MERKSLNTYSCGRGHMALNRKVVTSITSMATARTMRWKI